MSRQNIPMKCRTVIGFDATHIIYRRFSYDPATGFRYAQKPLRRRISDLPIALQPIDAFAAHAAVNPIQWQEEPVDETTPLAIPARVHAYVVLQLDNELPMEFDPGFPAISFGTFEIDQVTADRHYGDVMHFNSGTGHLQIEPCAKCRIAVFSVLPRTPESRQALNYNLVDFGGTAVTIDPDIRYPGNGGAVDERGGTP